VFILQGVVMDMKIIYERTSLYYWKSACVTGTLPKFRWSSDVEIVLYQWREVLKNIYSVYVQTMKSMPFFGLI